MLNFLVPSSLFIEKLYMFISTQSALQNLLFKLELCIKLQNLTGEFVCVGVGVGQSRNVFVGGGFGLGPLTPLGSKKFSVNVPGVIL